jgi:ribosomal protein S10
MFHLKKKNFFKDLKLKKKKKIITTLKSPHVNKIAQEQIDITSYKLQICFYNTNNKILYLKLSKLMQNLSFPDINFSYNFTFNKTQFFTVKKKSDNYNNKLQILKDNKIVLYNKKLFKNNYKILDQKGEIKFLNKIL